MATAVYIKNVMEVLLYLPLNATCGKAELSEAGWGGGGRVRLCLSKNVSVVDVYLRQWQ